MKKTFPISYQNSCIFCIANYQGGGSTSNAYYGLWKISSISKSGFILADGNGYNQNIYVLGY